MDLRKNNFFGRGILFLHEYSSLGQIRLPPKFQLPRQTPSGRKVCGRKEEERKKNNAKFSGHYVCPRTHYVHTNMQNVRKPGSQVLTLFIFCPKAFNLCM